jgi:Tfp pilus assembly protein PilO
MSALSPRVQYALAAVGVVALALAGYLLLVGPKRSEAARLDRELDELRSARVVQTSQSAKPSVVREFVLAKAMPDTTDMPGLVLDLNRLATTNGLDLVSLTPQPAVAGQGFEALPLQAVLEGRYGAVSGFLRRVRKRVGLRNGRVELNGRLYTVDKVDLAAGAEATGGRALRATLTLNAYRFGTGAASPAAGAPSTVAQNVTAASSP